MQLPWKKQERIDELEEEIERLKQQIDELKEEKKSYKERFQAEKERRSELSRKKQEAEKELKKLKQRSREALDEKPDEDDEPASAENISLQKAKRILAKLEDYNSPEEDLVTVYTPGKLGKLADTQGLKNSISRKEYEFISDEEFVGFVDPDLVQVKLKTRPFFSPKWSRGDSFRVEELIEFIEEEKQWAVVSAGETQIIREKNGEILERDEVGTRVDRKQKKGGFSQGRFERKRQEQIDEHLKQVKEKISENTLLVGEERLCKELSGEFLGGFDDSRNFVDALYGFLLQEMKEV